MESNESIQEKFLRVLNSFLDPSYGLKNDVYLETLITHLSGKHDAAYRELVNLPFVTEWLNKTTQNWMAIPESESVNHLSMAFTLRFMALHVENEWQFVKIKEKSVLERITTMLQNNLRPSTPSVKLAHVILLTSIAKHSIGLQWIKESKSWKTVVKYCQQNETVYVVREAMQFIIDLLEKLTTMMRDESMLDEILCEICTPLVESMQQEINNVCAVDNADLQRKLMPTLSLICHILQKCVESQRLREIASKIRETYRLEFHLWQFANITHDQLFLQKILRAFVLANFSSIDLQSEKAIDYSEFVINFFNYMNFCVIRRSSINIMYMAELNQFLWKCLGDRSPESVLFENQPIKFQDQVVLLQIFPILHVIKKKQTEKTELLDSYIMKLFDISCEHTTRLCYSFRDLLATFDDSTKADLACKSIQSILAVKNALHKDRAIIVLQALAFTLKEFVPEGYIFEPNVSYSDNTDELLMSPNLMSAILTGLYELIKNYRITWNECLESTCLLNFMLVLLANPNLSPRIAVQALKLTQLSIEHFLAPNLALLINNMTGSGMESLGPMILKKLHDNAWEVKDSTLELLTSIVHISDQKYPAFQQHIVDNDILPVVVAIMKHDSEPFVRASGLTCLRAMINIKMFRERLLNNTDIISHLLLVLNNETEAIVRREAVFLVAVVYEHNKISRSQLDLVFSTMAHSAVNDLHWEVKTNALIFWKIVMCQQFKHQGMIDGTFPTVTFSKENKKIVTLTEKEILLRLGKVLNELSLRGCLGVLLACLDDDCDLEVVKLTVMIIQKLYSFLNKYDYLVEREKIAAQNSSTSPDNRLPVVDTNYSEIKESIGKIESPIIRNDADSNFMFNGKNYDNIIESIVTCDDVNLLATTYENQLNMGTSESSMPQIDEHLFKEFAKVTADDFLNKIRSIDLDGLISKRSEWINQTESFGSLLDDMLFANERVDVNDADCY